MKQTYQRCMTGFLAGLAVICMVIGFSHADPEKTAQSDRHYQKGLEYFNNKDYRKASEEWLQAVTLNPHNNKAKESYDKAQEKYTQALSLFYEGAESFKKGDFISARKKFEESLALNPHDERVEFYLLVCQAPQFDAAASAPLFSSARNKNAFRINLDKSQALAAWIKEWTVEIRQAGGRTVRKLTGSGDPPNEVVWDLLDDSKKKIDYMNDLEYALRLKAIYGMEVVSSWKKIAVDNIPPEIRVKADESFVPGTKVNFDITVKDDQSGIAEWYLEIWDGEQEKVLLTLPGGLETASRKMEWDGSLSDGSKLSGGSTVFYQVVAFDKASNRAASAMAPIVAEIELIQEDRGLVMDLPNIEFDVGKATLKQVSHAILQQAGEILMRYPDKKFVIEGHTDDTGSYDFNMKLSEQRAESVYRYLNRNFKIPAGRVEIKGFGPSRPLMPNTSELNRRRNRRVEIIIQE